ncbi:hypothetical protein MMC06_000016 [Schaereria dolodes]|nr:hypothetical protein [Schaereria dolodes]
MLVNYSDSEASEGEREPIVERTENYIVPHKPGFQKVVDRSNPRKIIVSLPEFPDATTGENGDDEEPPTKRAKAGGGAFSGFNSFLPAPKRPAGTHGGIFNGINKRGGLGSGVNLKTGAAPGFSREPESGRERDYEAKQAADSSVVQYHEMPILADQNSAEAVVRATDGGEKLQEEPRKKGNSMMFKPLSVARKPQKKKLPLTSAAAQTSPDVASDLRKKPVTGKSLFSMGDPAEEDHNDVQPRGEYRPLIYQAPVDHPSQEPSDATAQDQEPNSRILDMIKDPSNSEVPDTASQSLDSIASDLRLSASAKRQLLGRQRNVKGKASTVNVVNFNTDEEYASNELLRQAGEQAQHNPVRSIAPGKHSLKQLVNAASTQKDALEEQFASGRRNKKEAGSKYGW